jgi:uncharacterized protein with ATP-grasp and redox domains
MIYKFPPVLMTSDPDSYARLTILERKPTIIAQVISDHHYPDSIVANLNKFKSEIADHEIKPLIEKSLDTVVWNECVLNYSGKTWLELPWYFAETYFYRKLLEATGYFQPGDTFHQDPFLPGKIKSLAADIPWFEIELQHYTEIIQEQRFSALFHSCLWGNRADLSNFTVKEQVQNAFDAHKQNDHILTDHTSKVEFILAKGCKRLDWICDNIGKEQLFDLATADFILNHFHCDQIIFHLKDRPFFVSDATIEDTLFTVDRLQNATKAAACNLGNRLIEHINANRIKLITNPFYTSCFMFRKLPDKLSRELASSDLVILKGDVNYRRLLDDCHWPYTIPMEKITSYFPAPFVTLRTFKGEILVDLAEGQAEEIARDDPDWLINGKRGVIRLVNLRN